MPFSSLEDVEARLANANEPLSEQEICEFAQWLPLMSETDKKRLDIQLDLQTIKAIRQMDSGGTRLAKSSLALNVALFALSIAALCIALKTYVSAEASGAGQTVQMLKQQQALDKSREALEKTLETIEAQQTVLDRLSKTADTQLVISTGQSEREKQRPVLTAVMVNPNIPAIVLRNTGTKTTSNPSYGGGFWDLSKSEGGIFHFVGIMTAKCDYIVPKSGCGPFKLSFPLSSPEPGDELFGYVLLQCPECVESKVCWVYIANGKQGFYAFGSYTDYDFSGIRAGNVKDTLAKFTTRKDLIAM